MHRTLKSLSLLTGIVCVAIGAFHFGLGIHSVPGEGHAGATIDSRERFYGAIFIGYGLAWIWVVRESTTPVRLVRWLAAIMLLGAVGRAISLITVGRPQAFQSALTVVEVVLPAIFLWCLRGGETNPQAVTRPESAAETR